MDLTADRWFKELKTKLDALHYSQPLTIDSCALVEKLLNDLLKTTGGFQDIKKQNLELRRNLELAEQALVPLKKENERVVIENNQLHREIIDVKELLESSDIKWRGKDQ